MRKPLPKLRSDTEAEQFVAQSDLTEYDLSGCELSASNFNPRASGSTCVYHGRCWTP